MLFIFIFIEWINELKSKGKQNRDWECIHDHEKLHNLTRVLDRRDSGRSNRRVVQTYAAGCLSQTVSWYIRQKPLVSPGVTYRRSTQLKTQHHERSLEHTNEGSLVSELFSYSHQQLPSSSPGMIGPILIGCSQRCTHATAEWKSSIKNMHCSGTFHLERPYGNLRKNDTIHRKSELG